MLPYTVSDEERKLITDIQDLGYGEIYDIKVPRLPVQYDLELSDKFISLLKYFRRGHHPTCRIDKLIVHHSEPQIAEVEIPTTSGRRSIQKIKF
jgi:hypothetical protein